MRSTNTRKTSTWLRRGVLLLLTLLAASSLISLAQADDTQKRQDLRKLLTLIDPQAMMEQQADRTVASLKERYPMASAAQWKEIRAELVRGGLVEELIPIYDTHLTREEVTALLSFYDSPAGRSLVKKLPRLQQEAAAAAEQMGRQRGEMIRTKLSASGATP